MARPKLKPVCDQTIVITGGSSGIGLLAARRAAKRGARLFLIARNEAALAAICDDIARSGGQAGWADADMGAEAEAEAAAEAAIRRFGGFDSWVNCAAVGLYQALEHVSDADHRRVFDTNYFGVVHGSRAAVRHLKTRPGGGAVINVGSVGAELAIPMLGVYAASKHAVRGFTDALRMELMRAPVSVTLIKPSSIDSPFVEHAMNTMPRAARVPPPVYRPEAAADAILAACAHRYREITVGFGGQAVVTAGRWLPRLSDRLFARTAYAAVQSRSAPARPDSNLYAPGRDGQVRGPHRGVIPVSPYTRYQTTKAGRALAALLAIAAVALTIRRNAERARSLARMVEGGGRGRGRGRRPAAVRDWRKMR